MRVYGTTKSRGMTREGPLVFFNIGWMNHYRGQGDGDSISSGGTWVEEHGIGYEMYNFAPHSGNYYGAVQPPGGYQIHIERLGAARSAEHIDGVTVAWVAKRPQGGLRLVGWYGNARVYRHWQEPPPGADRAVRRADEQAHYLAVASVDKSVLLPLEERTLEILRGSRGAMGQANVWFAQSELGRKTASSVRAVIHEYAQRGVSPGEPGNSVQRLQKASRTNDTLRKAQVEQAAVGATRAFYEAQGFEVSDVQRDNLGWDLEAARDGERLLVEVKGLSGAGHVAELTPNEYMQMRKMAKQYRLCVVSNCLDPQTLQLRSFSFSRDGKWIDQHGCSLQVEPMLGARVYLRSEPE